MPEVSRFLRIVIKMFIKEHNPPHFHAFYAGDEHVYQSKESKLLSRL